MRPQQTHLNLLINEAFGIQPCDAREYSEGTFGIVWEALLPSEPRRVIVKWQKSIGRGLLEKRQLEELRKYSVVKVPEVYYYHAATDDLPFDALVMEYIEGVPASEIDDPEHDAAERLAHDLVDILLSWHTVRNPLGYGDLDGPYYQKWTDHYGKRIAIYHSTLHSMGNAAPVAMLDMADSAADITEDVLGSRCDQAVLIHSDFWLPNILVDPYTLQVTGVIDPLDAEWADRELDLILVDWPWGDPHYILNLYQQRFPLDAGFPLRYAFYEFWYAMQTFIRAGWRTDENDKRVIAALRNAINRYL